MKLISFCVTLSLLPEGNVTGAKLISNHLYKHYDQIDNYCQLIKIQTSLTINRYLPTTFHASFTKILVLILLYNTARDLDITDTNIITQAYHRNHTPTTLTLTLILNWAIDVKLSIQFLYVHSSLCNDVNSTLSKGLLRLYNCI